MDTHSPEFVEAVRLARKFFPEAVSFAHSDVGLDWNAFLGSMMTADYSVDCSCDALRRESDPDLGFAGTGGFDGSDEDVYARILAHTSIVPSGRAIVVPDAIGFQEWSKETCPPFVCDSRRVPERLREIQCFESSRNTLFVFESGDALLIDHDQRIHWARSRINQRQVKAT